MGIYHSEYLGLDRMIILKYSLGKLYGRVSIGLIWLRIGTVSRLQQI
jgi:hypothetical protein